MFPKHRKGQAGFLIPLAAFIVVGLAVLALALTRISSQASQSAFLEGVSMQALYAAESGAQTALSAIFFDVSDRATATATCSGYAVSLTFPAVPGLQACSARASCVVSSEPGYFTITGIGRCGSGDIFARRTIEVSAFL